MTERILHWTDKTILTSDYLRKIIDRHGHLDGPELMQVMLKTEMADQFALVSSFGVESAVLLHMVAQIDPATPVIFIDPLRLFPETLEYKKTLVDRLGLKDVRTCSPPDDVVQKEDGKGDLYRINPDACCKVRKVDPLNKALEDFNGWISGRKRFHGGNRSNLSTIEMSDGRVKLNPLAFWSLARIKEYFNAHGLPSHPLRERGYLSVGCASCTSKPIDESNIRSGRWAGQNKTECGLHVNEAGRLVRRPG